jgi:hypothetical protein
MEQKNNPDARDFDRWAQPAIESGIERWKLRALAVSVSHEDIETDIIG